VLATVPDVDATRRVATTPHRAPARAGVGRRDRLEPGRHRQFDGGGERGGNILGPNPTDKGRAGCKRHLVVDAHGIPLAARLTKSNVHDCQRFEELLDAIPALKQRGPGRPRRRPGKAHADKGYDFKKCREACRVRGIQHRIARRGIESKERLGRHRWVIERTFAWLNKQRRLMIRFDRWASHYVGFLHLGCVLICWNYLSRL
jgi:transposase